MGKYVKLAKTDFENLRFFPIPHTFFGFPCPYAIYPIVLPHIKICSEKKILI